LLISLKYDTEGSSNSSIFNHIPKKIKANFILTMFRLTATTIILSISLILCLSKYGSAFSSSSPFAALAAGSKATTGTREHVVLSAFGTSVGTNTKKDVKTLLSRNRRVIDSLASVVGDDDNVSELTRLRFAMAFERAYEAKTALRDALAYRKTAKGKSVVDAAFNAYETAKIGGGWDNEVVRNAAPHASVINKFITSKNIVTASTADGDLVYVIRASLIDDRKMMNSVTVNQLSEFFMYVKEVHNLVANQRSEQTGRLCEVIFVNDIEGVRKAPDSRFSKALSSSSSQYEKLYPSLAGPTLIVNLPFVLQAFVGLFKPLFPQSVQAKLKFVRAPVLARLRDLVPLANYNGVQRKNFLAEVEKIIK